MSTQNLKMVIAVRKDLKLPKGLLAQQACHAAVALTVMDSNRKQVQDWLSGRFTKVLVYVEDESSYIKLYEYAEKAGVYFCLIAEQSGKNYPKGTYTVMGLGPDTNEKLDPLTKHLKLV